MTRKPTWKLTRNLTLLVLFAFLASAAPLRGQAPTGPIAPQPGAPIQQAPQQTKIVTQVSLVNTPATVLDSRGQMVHTLEAKDFQITDNGVPQKITHFDMGGDPLSLVFLVETSARIAPLLPRWNKMRIVPTETVMGPSGEAAVVGFNDSVDKLQDFTTSHDAVEKIFTKLNTATRGSKLYDAMAIGVEMLSGRSLATAETPGR